ncbi:hypothetical protein PCAR4_60065 [Paraburkholderia caribensis]|nr:hypothetical protein PCAR4_60065 [Paraburkholderia caribensis]
MLCYNIANIAFRHDDRTESHNYNRFNGAISHRVSDSKTALLHIASIGFLWIGRARAVKTHRTRSQRQQIKTTCANTLT